MNGLMFEVLASESPGPDDVVKTITFVFRWDRSFNLQGALGASRFAAINNLITSITAEAWISSQLENPHITYIPGPRVYVGSTIAVYHGSGGSSGGQLFDNAAVATTPGENGGFISSLIVPSAPETPVDEELISIVWTFNYEGE